MPGWSSLCLPLQPHSRCLPAASSLHGAPARQPLLCPLPELSRPLCWCPPTPPPIVNIWGAGGQYSGWCTAVYPGLRTEPCPEGPVLVERTWKNAAELLREDPEGLSKREWLKRSLNGLNWRSRPREYLGRGGFDPAQEIASPFPIRFWIWQEVKQMSGQVGIKISPLLFIHSSYKYLLNVDHAPDTF